MLSAHYCNYVKVGWWGLLLQWVTCLYIYHLNNWLQIGWVLGVDVDNIFLSTFLPFGVWHSGKSRKIQYATLHSKLSALLTGKWKFILSLKPWTQGILDDWLSIEEKAVRNSNKGKEQRHTAFNSTHSMGVRDSFAHTYTEHEWND